MGTSVPCHTEPEARSRKTTGGWITQHRAQKQRVGWGRNQPAWTWKRRWSLEPELKCRLNMRGSSHRNRCSLLYAEAGNLEQVRSQNQTGFCDQSMHNKPETLDLLKNSCLPQEVLTLVTAARLWSVGAWDKYGFVACRTWRTLALGAGAAKHGHEIEDVDSYSSLDRWGTFLRGKESREWYNSFPLSF